MDENGYYDGYIDFVLVIKAKYRDIFGKLIIDIKGKFGKYKDIKDYLYESFDYALSDM